MRKRVLFVDVGLLVNTFLLSWVMTDFVWERLAAGYSKMGGVVTYLLAVAALVQLNRLWWGAWRKRYLR